MNILEKDQLFKNVYLFETDGIELPSRVDDQIVEGLVIDNTQFVALDQEEIRIVELYPDQHCVGNLGSFIRYSHIMCVDSAHCGYCELSLN